MSFSKPQVSFPSNFAWLFSVMKDHSFLRSKVLYFAQKGPIKIQIFETFEWSDENSPKFCHTLQYYEAYVLCIFLDEILYAFNKRSLSKHKFGEISTEQSKI